MATKVDTSLVENHIPWLHSAFDVLEAMAVQGNLIAGFLRSELHHLDAILSRCPANVNHNVFTSNRHGAGKTGISTVNNVQSRTSLSFQQQNRSAVLPVENVVFQTDELYWQDPVTTEQLMTVADAIDLEGMNWPWSSLLDSEE